MNQEQWSAVDRYTNGLLLTPDVVMDSVLKAGAAAGLPAIDVAPNQDKLLWLLASLCGVRRILEIGTLAGYSTIWLARALPADGKLITLEVNPKHAEVAQANIAQAGLHDVMEVRLGPALDSLAQIAAEGVGPFDLIFIDADKQNNADYFRWALKLARRGSLIITDNVVRNGAILDAASSDPSVQGTRQFFEAVANEPRVSATAIQTVGVKGYDGFALLLVMDEPH